MSPAAVRRREGTIASGSGATAIHYHSDARRPDRRIMLRFLILEASAENEVNTLSELHAVIHIGDRHGITAAFKWHGVERQAVFEEDQFDNHRADLRIHRGD